MQRLEPTRVPFLPGLFLAGALLAPPAAAHFVSPDSAELRPGASSLVMVQDFGGCGADITVWTLDPAAVRVWALDPLTGQKLAGDGLTAFMPDTDLAYFIIEGSLNVFSPVQTSIEVCWIGSDFPSGTCNENNCDPPAIPHSIPVTVQPAPMSNAALPFAGWEGDPVKTATGEQFLPRRPLLDLGGPLGVELGLFYGSAMDRTGAPAGHLGPGWRNDTDWTLTLVGDGAHEITTPDGMVARFQRTPPLWDYVLTPYNEVPFQLTRPAPGTEFKLLDPRTNLVYSFENPGLPGWVARAKRVEDGKGNVQTRTTSLNNPVTAISDGLGRQITLAYQAGRLVSASDGTRTVTFGHDAAGQLITLVDAAGNSTSFLYDPAHPGEGLLVSEERPEGNRPVTSVYDAEQRVIEQRDGRNNVTTFSYGAGGATTVADPLGHEIEHVHSENGELLEHTDAVDQTVSMTYNADGQRTAFVDRNGNPTGWTIHPASGRVGSYTDAEGQTTSFSYASRQTLGFDVWDLVGATFPDRSTETYTRDAQGNVTSFTNRLGKTWTTTYGSNGLPSTRTDPDGDTTIYSYNADGTLADETDPDGNVTAYAYDVLGRRVSRTNPDGTVRSRAVDVLDRVLSEISEDGAVTQFTYDGNGNRLTEVDPLGATRAYTYDENDRLSTATDPLGNVTGFAYEERNKLAKITSSLLIDKLLSYGPNGRLLGETDAAGETWSLGRDAEGVLTATTTPRESTSTVTLDATGRPTISVDPRGWTRSVTRNDSGLPVSFTNALGKTSTLSRDATGAVTGVTLPVPGLASTLIWNALGDLESITDPGGNVHQYEYDHGHRLEKRTDPLNRVTVHDYDMRGRRVTTTLPAPLGQVNFTWAPDGMLIQESGSDGAMRQYSYDPANRLTGGTGLSRGYDSAGNVVSSNGISATYDADHKLTSYELAPNKTVTVEYDPAGYLREINDWLGNFIRFELDEDGRLIQERRSSGVPSGYVFDPANNVIQETHGTAYLAFYEYDGENRCTAERIAAGSPPWIPGPGAASYSCDAAGQLNGATHDERGRLLDDGRRQCTWNTLGDLTSVGDGVDTVQFGYDCEKRVVTREVVGSGLVTSYVWNDACDGGLGVCRENGVDAAYWITRPDGEPLWKVDAATGHVTWNLFDTRGDLVATTDDAGDVQCTHGYLPFGEPLGPSGGCACPFTYRGAEGWLREPIGELYLTPDGPCDGTLGRFLQPGAPGFGPMSCNSYRTPWASFAAPAAAPLPELRSLVDMDTPSTSGARPSGHSWRGNFISPSPGQAVYKFAPDVAQRWFGPWREGLGFDPAECTPDFFGVWRTELRECGCEIVYTSHAAHLGNLCGRHRELERRRNEPPHATDIEPPPEIFDSLEPIILGETWWEERERRGRPAARAARDFPPDFDEFGAGLWNLAQDL